MIQQLMIQHRMVQQLSLGFCAGRASTRPGPPLEPEAVQLVGAPTTSALQLCWQAPASRGTPVTAYHLECCRASALPSLANSSLSASASATDLNSHSAATGEPEARSLASTLAKLDREAHAGVPVPSVRPASELDGSEQASTVSSGEDQNHASASAGNHVGPPSRSGKRGRRGRGNSLEKPPASGWHTVYTGNAHATEVKGKLDSCNLLNGKQGANLADVDMTMVCMKVFVATQSIVEQASMSLISR